MRVKLHREDLGFGIKALACQPYYPFKTFLKQSQLQCTGAAITPVLALDHTNIGSFVLMQGATLTLPA